MSMKDALEKVLRKLVVSKNDSIEDVNVIQYGGGSLTPTSPNRDKSFFYQVEYKLKDDLSGLAQRDIEKETVKIYGMLGPQSGDDLGVYFYKEIE